ncbi:neck protein [Pantoea phage vB_PagS_Vid5]|uniref:Neck protein n=1 Tax=Pantoea phage vB_PagS_Vid5 TaxID=2099652 RepID=A0A2P1CKR0_9CAUD|nr:tail completion or Neck1 protein [Pantoea phage vB_PagS_Vid5]AVJ51768.1 neck protein [Pantoea phage vB_PagS_Vid5]
MSFSSGFAVLSEQAIVHSVKQAKDVAKSFTHAVIDGTPVKTGALKGDWSATTQGPAIRADRPLDPMGISTKMRIDQFIDTLPTKSDWLFHFTNTKPYAYKAEFLGLSAQAPYGMVRIQISKLAQFVRSATGGVR